jgi:hypothetical protein
MAHVSGIVPERTLRAESSILSLKGLEIGLLAIVDADFTLRFLDLKTYRLFGGDTLALNATDEAISIDIAFKGHLCVAALPEGAHAQVFSVKQHKAVQQIGLHSGAVSCVRIDPSSRYAVTAGDDGKAAAWDLKSGKRIYNIPQHSDRIEAVAFNKEATLVATGGFDRTVQLFQPGSTAGPKMLRGHNVAISALCFTEGYGLVSGDRDGGIVLWDTRKTAIRKRLAKSDGKIVALCIGDTPDMLFAATSNGSVSLYDLESGEAAAMPYLKFVHPVTAMAYCREQQKLAVGTAEGGIHIIAPFGDKVRFEQVTSRHDYDSLYRMARENAALRFSPLYRRLQEEWAKRIADVDELIAADRIDEAEVALVHLKGNKAKQSEIDILGERLRAYKVFKEHVQNGRYAVAYDLAFKNPGFRNGVAYKQMDSAWKQAYEKAARLLQDKRTEAEGMALLTPFRGISEKTAAIRELVENSQRYVFFKELISRQEWKKACDLVRHNPQLRNSNAYKALLDVADKLFISAQKAYSAHDFKSARAACETLLAFADYKEDAKALLDRMKG